MEDVEVVVVEVELVEDDKEELVCVVVVEVEVEVTVGVLVVDVDVVVEVEEVVVDVVDEVDSAYRQAPRRRPRLRQLTGRWEQQAEQISRRRLLRGGCSKTTAAHSQTDTSAMLYPPFKLVMHSCAIFDGKERG